MKSLSNELRKSLCDVLNNNSLSVDIKYYILKDVFRDVESAYFQYLTMEEPKNNEDDEPVVTVQKKEGTNEVHVEITGNDIQKVVEKTGEVITGKKDKTK